MLRIYLTPTIPDSRAVVKKNTFNQLGLKHKVGAVYLADCYAIDKKLDKKQTEKAARLLTNPIIEKSQVVSGVKDQGLRIKDKFQYAIEIGYLPGVTDNIGSTARETLEDGLRLKFKPGESVYTSQVVFINGGLSRAEINKIAYSLYNPLIQKATVKTFNEIKKDGVINPVIPKVKLSASTAVSKIDLEISESDLQKLGKLGVLNKDGSRRGPLSLSLDYLLAIREYFRAVGRKPTDVELETLAQTWSEHCKHTIFADPMDKLSKGIYKTYIKGATEVIRAQQSPGGRTSGGHRGPTSRRDFCVSVFTDNAGGIAFDKDYIITHKVETHNTPSALDPFGGAITGIVGVNRDCLGFGLGAKPVINIYGFCVADPNDKTELYRDKEKTNKMLSAKRILEGVVAGINAGGNQSGIPTNLGFVYFDHLYRGKPLVFAGTVGLIPRNVKNKPSYIKQAKTEDLIVMVGGRVGADGIHGATFSSEGLDAHSPATAVQIGDAITQKKFSDAIAKEARDLGLFTSITDCGAGGLSSAVGEMAQLSGGCLVNLEKVPLKYPGLAPWQIWISESQERMVLAVPKKNWQKFSKLMKRRGVEATIIGKFTGDGKCVVKFGKQTVLDLDMDFLHNGRPIKQLWTKAPDPVSLRANASERSNLIKDRHVASRTHSRLLAMTGTNDLNDLTQKLLSRLNIASFEFISKQYDHEVQAGSVLKPLQGAGRINSDATVTRPILTSKKGVVLANALYPSYSELGPYKMAAASIDGAVRAAVAAGANIDYLALLDNFCWSSSENPERLWQLKEAARACYDVATTYGTPFISGKDSMFNDFKGYDRQGNPLKISIPPTLLISAIGVVPDITKTVSLDAKMAGDLIYILGNTNNELGGSEFMQMQSGPHSPPFQGGVQPKAGEWLEYKVPTVDAPKNYSLYKSLYNAIQQDLIASAISVSRGGLVAAMVKMLMGGNLGGEINLTGLPGNWQESYQALFSESTGRILVTVDPKKAMEFEAVMAGQTFAMIGRVSRNNKIIINNKENKKIVNLKINSALKTYIEPLSLY